MSDRLKSRTASLYIGTRSRGHSTIDRLAPADYLVRELSEPTKFLAQLGPNAPVVGLRELRAPAERGHAGVEVDVFQLHPHRLLPLAERDLAGAELLGEVGDGARVGVERAVDQGADAL